jgi:hypothetical protein
MKILFLSEIKNITLLRTKNIPFILYLIVGCIVVIKGPFYYPDSYAFLDMSINHSPVYSLFLKIFRIIFNDSFIWPVIITQFLILISAIHYLSNVLQKQFHLNLTEKFILQFILISPSIYFNQTTGAVLTEAISYPLVLIVFALGFKAFAILDIKLLLKSIIPLYFLVLTRGQFIVVIPVFIAVGVYINYQNRRLSTRWLPIILLVLLPFFTSISERCYNKLMYGYYVNNSMNYVHIISADFYLSKSTTVEIFDDLDEIEYFKIIHESLKNVELTEQSADAQNKSDIEVYVDNFPKICNRRIYDLGLNYFQKKGLNYFEQHFALNKLCKGMFFKMLKHNFKTRVSFFIKNLKLTYGTAKHLFLFIFLISYSLIKVYKTKSTIYKFILLGSVLMLANNVLIAFVMHAIKRYAFYYYWIIFAIIILILSELSKKTSNEN